MNSREVDVVVVGLGPGGESAATQLARAGLDVLAVDRRLVGGECPYYGCIPSKMMVRAADVLAEARRVDGLAGTASVTADWADVARRIKDEATADWDDTVAVERLEKAGATVVHGEARLVGTRQVEVALAPSTGSGRSAETWAARKGVVLNTGTEPAAPPVDGLAGTPYWTNRDAVRADTAPASLIVLGVGAVGAEMAQAFARFGTRVTAVELFDRILAVEEPEASKVVAEVFAREGIQVLTDTSVDRVSYDDGTFTVEAAGQRLTADRLLVATGRRNNIADIGLDSVGVDADQRALETDGRMRVTGAQGLWAVGDITGQGAFTHVSMYQAAIAVRDILGQDGPEAAYHAVPRVTFTDPEVGSVGLTEKQARDAGLRVQVGTTDLGASTRGWIAQAEGVVKVVADADRGVLVGATVVGPAGGEALSMLATAVHAEVPVATLRSMIYAYPTFHRAVEEALKALG
jgi:pyruvate/2-oxoglutarate dehydrogenase complex dihydrolipoamide dehydrogenase (E3) component